MNFRKSRAFTLTEILITLSILGVLSGLAVPSFFRTVERARSNEAITNLNVIYMGQRIFRLNNGTFWNGGGPALTTIPVINAALNTEMTAQFYPTADMRIALAGTNYTASLTRNGFLGGNGTDNCSSTFTVGMLAPLTTCAVA